MIYWCKKCKTPIFEKGLHSCSCDGKITKISESSICNPVFKQEKKLLEKIMDCSLGNEIIWYLGASKYLINEKIVKIPYREWYWDSINRNSKIEFELYEYRAGN